MRHSVTTSVFSSLWYPRNFHLIRESDCQLCSSSVWLLAVCPQTIYFFLQVLYHCEQNISHGGFEWAGVHECFPCFMISLMLCAHFAPMLEYTLSWRFGMWVTSYIQGEQWNLTGQWVTKAHLVTKGFMLMST